MIPCRSNVNPSTLSYSWRYLASWLVLTAFLSLSWPSEAAESNIRESQILLLSRRRLQKEAISHLTLQPPSSGRKLHHSKSSKSKSSKGQKSSKYGRSISKVGKNKSSKSKAKKSKSSKSKAVKSKSSKSKTSKSAKSAKSKFSKSKSKSHKGGKSEHSMKIYEGGHFATEKAYDENNIQLNETSTEAIEQSTTEFEVSNQVIGGNLSETELLQSSAETKSLNNSIMDDIGNGGPNENYTDAVSNFVPSDMVNAEETYGNLNLEAIERIEGNEVAENEFDENNENESDEAVE
mmetsp:Transcript_4901/g.10011  ORF Transcript_4901/g.10011 Transcript_4901/m.10011 type:complete len:292 (-) Transcript_4901:3-878(-)